MFRLRRRRNLPHVEADGAIYFVTFRLADSLPRTALDRIQRELHRTPASNLEIPAPSLSRRLSPRIEEFLDAGAGACLLGQPAVASIMASSVGAFAEVRYRLFAWCVMPNHVHVVLQPLQGWSLPRIVHSWKTFTVKQANHLLGRDGEFWQREYCDHLVRDADDLARLVRYVLENPARSGLVNWPWVGTAPWNFSVPLPSSRRL
jgi:REP element-mobilizing transposase RayT